MLSLLLDPTTHLISLEVCKMLNKMQNLKIKLHSMYPILWLFSVLVFRGMTVPKSSEPQQSWPDYTPVSPSIWDTEPNHSWAASTGSPATPTTVRYHFLITCLIQMDTCDPKENINTKITEYHSDYIKFFILKLFSD